MNERLLSYKEISSEMMGFFYINPESQKFKFFTTTEIIHILCRNGIHGDEFYLYFEGILELNTKMLQA